jgi:Outer membrane protein beta-barrel domain
MLEDLIINHFFSSNNKFVGSCISKDSKCYICCANFNMICNMLSLFSNKLFLAVSFFFIAIAGIAQEEESIQKPIKIDSLYREDQFFVGLTYNSLRVAPKGYSNDKISLGFTAGFLRDMPINKNRTFAIAAGLGMTYNNYNHNFGVSGSNQQPNYAILGDGTYSKNKFSIFTADLPIEFRWRASTFESTKFWRIYAGFKLSYLLYDRNRYEAVLGQVTIKNNPDLNKLRYGVYLASGYNTLNVYIHYGLNSLFKSGQVGVEQVQFHNLNIGILFYIL